MTSSRQKLALFLSLMFTALIVLIGMTSLNPKTVAAVAQDTSRTDVKLASKPLPPPQTASPTAPANDNCANAIVITDCPFNDSRSTVGATTEAGEPAPCGGIGATVWYTATNPTSNRFVVTVSTCGSSFDTALAAYRAPGAACDFAGLVNVACNDDFCGLQSSIQFTADPGATYKIQAGGFNGGTGDLVIGMECQEIVCPDIVIHGTLGSNDPGFPGPRASGNQTGRLNRNGVGSTCAIPKACAIFDPAGLRAFDSYTIPNASGQDACVSVNLTENAGQTCNLQSNAYLDTYNPAAICTGYLADPGLSTGVPPTPTNFSFVVPAGHALIVVVHTTNPGETGCTYTLTVTGNLCEQFDYCVQNDTGPKRFIQISSTTGAYKYQDCAKGLTLTGRGGVSTYFCKTELFDFGPDPKRPDRFIDVLVNTCTKVGNATIQFGSTSVTLRDSNVTNNTCGCP